LAQSLAFFRIFSPARRVAKPFALALQGSFLRFVRLG
jgi:hypothetical protein